MKKILLLSDTHSHIDDTILKYVDQADEVWHAGDIGNLVVTDTIKKGKLLRAVYGNIDDDKARLELISNPPKLFICGHSHILKVQFDKKLNILHMNPGAAGKSGFHQVRTMLRFSIDGEKISDLEIIEIEKRV